MANDAVRLGVFHFRQVRQPFRNPLDLRCREFLREAYDVSVS
jgi:hypothetical protein